MLEKTNDGTRKPLKKKYDVSSDVEVGFSVKDMSKLLSVSESTIFRRMRSYGIAIRSFTDIDDIELDNRLSDLIAEFPRCGEQMLRSLLSIREIKVIIYL